MNIGIIGAGRLGLCYALLLEQAKYRVVVSDVRSDYVRNLNQKQIETFEPEVSQLLKKTENFEATISNQEVIEKSDLIYTFVPTPSLAEGRYNISNISHVIDDFLSLGKDFSDKTFVIGSTVNPGDCLKFQEKLKICNLTVCYNPEFIAQGSIINDLCNADMVLVGAEEGEGVVKKLEVIKKIYESFQNTPVNFCSMSLKAAEITKIALNCFLTTKITYANMIGEILHLSGLGLEVNKVLETIGKDTRVGNKYLKYGFGYGGPCLPRDNKALGHYMQQIDLKDNLPLAVDKFNDHHRDFLKSFYTQKNPDKTLPFLMTSIAYKKETNILEESQAYQLCLDLLNDGYQVYVVDDNLLERNVIDELAEKYGRQIFFVTSKNEIKKEVICIDL